jgi:hypothetical protein
MAYKLERERDGMIFIGDNFVSLKHRIGENNLVTSWPPKKGESTLTYNTLQDYWQTTQVEKIISLTDDKCKFETENSVYELIKDFKNEKV